MEYSDKMVSLKIKKNKEGKCSKCNEQSVMLIEDLDSETGTLFCAKHYIESEGEHEVENDLRSISNLEDYTFWDPLVAREVTKQFPDLADKYGKTLRKIIQIQEKRPGKKLA